MSNLNSLSNNNSFNKKNVSFTSKSKGRYSNLFALLISLIALVVIIIVIYHLRKAYVANQIPNKANVVLEKYAFDCKNNHKIIENASMPTSVIGNEYNLTFWIYINGLDFNYMYDKNVMIKGDIVQHLEDDTIPPAVANPRIFIPKETNNLEFQFEVDHFLDPDEGCYDVEKSGIGDLFNAPAMLEEKCKNLYINDDYYALTKPERDTDGIFRSKCTGFNKETMETIKSKTGGSTSNRNCVDNDIQLNYDYTLGNQKNMYVQRSQNKNDKEQKITIKNIPLQRWNFVSFNVHNNKVDIFFNGELHLSKDFKGSIKPNTFPLMLGGITNKGESGFDGYLSNINYSNYALTEAEILGGNSLYRNGPKIFKDIRDSFSSLLV